MNEKATSGFWSTPARIGLGIGFLSICVWVPLRLAELLPLEETDFFTFWLAGKMNWLGMNPLDPLDWADAHRMFGAAQEANPTFLYPLPAAILLAPLGLLTLQEAFVLWGSTSLVLILACIVILMRIWGGTTKLPLVLPVLTAGFLFRPTILTAAGGQMSGFLLIILGLAGLALERRAWLWAGLLIGLLTLKPSIGGPFGILSAAWLLSQRRWNALLGMVVAGAGLLVLGMARDAGWLLDYVNIGVQKVPKTYNFSACLWGMSGAVCRFDRACTVWMGGVLTLLLMSGSMVLLIQRRWNLLPREVLGLITCVSLLATPHLWPYDQTLLILPILATVAFLVERRAPFLLIATLFLWVDLLALILVGVTMRIEMEIWNGLLSFACLLLVGVQVVLRSRTPLALNPSPGGS